MKIPDDIGIAGWDNLPWLNFFNPPISVNSLPMYEMGMKAAEILITRLKAKKTKHNIKEILFKSKFISRKSIKNINENKIV